MKWPACAVLLLIVLLAPSWAAAHAVLLDATPAAGARLEQSPTSIVLHFDEAVETAVGSVRVLDRRGVDRARAAPSHPAGDASTITVPVPELERGPYVVAWRVVSADSHVVSGAYAFGVREDPGEVPAAVTDSIATGFSVFLIVARCVVLASLLIATGMSVSSHLVGVSRRSPPVTMLELGAWLALAVSSYVEISFQADLTGGSLTAVLATRFGMLRLAMVGAGFAGLIAVSGKTRFRPVLFAATAVAIASEALSGHALTSAHPVFSVPIDALHLIAAAIWIGALLTTIVVPNGVDARRVSNVATSAVIVLVLSAIGQSLSTISSPAALVATTYGRLVCAKIALFGLTLAFAAAARRRVGLDARALGPSVRRELVVLGAIVVVTAVLVDGVPPRAWARAAPVASVAFAVRDLRVLARAERRDPATWRLHVSTRSGDRLRDADEIIITLAEPEKRVGPLPVALSHVAPGEYEGDARLPFPGQWSVTVRARSGEFDENAAVLNVPTLIVK